MAASRSVVSVLLRSELTGTKLPRAADAGKRGLGLPSPNELVPARGRDQPPETATVGVSLVTSLQPCIATTCMAD